MLRNFPDNSPALKQKKEEIKKELETAKKVIEQTMLKGNVQETNAGIGINENLLLGELLGYLRTNKLMSALMVCRQISQIKIEESQAVIYGDGGEDLPINETTAAELKKFFETKGLGYKIYKKTKSRNPIDELNEILDGKLKVE